MCQGLLSESPSLGIGLKAFAYAHTNAEVYFTAKTVCGAPMQVQM